MLATLWWPNTNPIGPDSLWPLVFVGCYVLWAFAVKWRWMIVIGPVVFAVAAGASEAYPFNRGRRFPNADDYVGYYIYILAACCMALEVARSGSLRALLYGGVVLLPLGWLLAFEATFRFADLVSWNRGPTFRDIVLTSTPLWLLLFAALMRRAAQPYLRAQRLSRRLCGSCGYDMRQSPARCPECGTPSALPSD